MERFKSSNTESCVETLGKRSIRHTKKGLFICNEEIANLIKDKKEAYLKLLNENSQENKIEYKRRSAIAKR